MAASTPSDRVYSESHEWHKVEGDSVTLGLTSFAVDQLTDCLLYTSDAADE